MKIILEKVQKGERVTGVAKIMDGTKNVNNVPFNVSSKDELDNFCERLLEIQQEFSTVVDGEYVVPIKEDKVLTEAEIALDKIYKLKEQINLGIIKETDQEFIDAVEAYKLATVVKTK